MQSLRHGFAKRTTMMLALIGIKV